LQRIIPRRFATTGIHSLFRAASIPRTIHTRSASSPHERSAVPSSPTVLRRAVAARASYWALLAVAMLAALVLAVAPPAIAAVQPQQFECVIFDNMLQRADRDLAREFPLIAKSCRPLGGVLGDPMPLKITSGRQFRCMLFDGSLQMADRDLTRDYPLAIKSCKPLVGLDEPVLARSVDSSVDALVVIAPPLQAGSRRTTASQPIASMIRTASLHQGLDPGLVSALVYVESRYNPNARSPKGAMGLMQIMPATAARYGVASAASLLDPQVNVDVGTRYLRDLHKMFNGRTDLVLAAYNAGEGSVQRYGYRVPPFLETQNYVRQIIAMSGTG